MEESERTEHSEHKNEAADELSFDLSKLKALFKKHYVWLLILIPIFLSIYFRMSSAGLPMTDNWATNNVDNFIKQDISTFISQSYPNLPATNKNKLVEDEFAKAIKQDSYTIKTGDYKGQTISIKTEIAKSSQSLKEFWQYENEGKKFVYMPDIDPYVYLMYARNYLDHGHIGSEIKNGVPWDGKGTAPIGGKAPTKQLHPYLLAWLYKVMHVFKPSFDLMTSSTYFPIIFSALSIIPIFFIGRKLAGNVGGFLAAVMMAINPAFLSRTTWGHADTDSYVIFFSVYAIWMFFEAFESKKLSSKLIFTSLSGLLMGLFAFAWSGWWYVFDFMLATEVAYLVYLLATSSKVHGLAKAFKTSEFKNTFLVFVTLVVVTGIFVTLFSSFGEFRLSVTQPLKFMQIKEAAHPSLWPNVYTTVAELNAASYDQIVSAIGGKLFLVISLLGIAFTLLRKENEKFDPKYAIILTVWFASTIYASTQGIRFTMLLVPALSIAFGNALGRIYSYANMWSEKGLHLNKKISAPVVLLIFFLLLLGPAKEWRSSTVNDVPIVNDAWWNALTKINQQSEPNAIINSWWDFGHHFKYIADRAVTFDGGSQNTPMAHWIGKVLLTSNEKEAIGILKMLNCGSNRAFVELDKKINDVSKSVKILYAVVTLDKTGAESLLAENGLDTSEAAAVLQYTHCAPPEDYFITSEDMVGKAGVWAHFGSWNFDRADVWLMRNEPKEKIIDLLTKDNNYSQSDAEAMYEEVQSITDEKEGNSWIAPWPNYASGIMSCGQNGKIVQCEGLTVDLETMNVTIETQQGALKPASIVYVDGDDIVEKKFPSETDLSVSLIPTNNGYNAIIMQKQLALSMFNRLYFFLGHGLSYFKPFDSQRQLTGGAIYTWKVDWGGIEKNEIYTEEENKTETKKEAAEQSANESPAPNITNETAGVLIE